MNDKKFDIISPDGFSIDPTLNINSWQEAEEALQKWIERYEEQGYYSSNWGRIELENVPVYCKIVEFSPKGISLHGFFQQVKQVIIRDKFDYIPRLSPGQILQLTESITELFEEYITQNGKSVEELYDFDKEAEDQIKAAPITYLYEYE